MEVKFVILLFLIILFVITSNGTNNTSDVKSSNEIKVLSRKKRYLVFPEGSTLSVAICMTAQTFLQPTELFTEAINWGVSYDLPNNTDAFENLHQPGFATQRRFRRDLYRKMETIITSMGFNGRECIYRTLCEAAGFFKSLDDTGDSGTNLIEEIIKLVFSFPQQKILASEATEHTHYRKAHENGGVKGVESCGQIYPDCGFSLLEMALNYFEGFHPNS